MLENNLFYDVKLMSWHENRGLQSFNAQIRRRDLFIETILHYYELITPAQRTFRNFSVKICARLLVETSQKFGISFLIMNINADKSFRQVIRSCSNPYVNNSSVELLTPPNISTMPPTSKVDKLKFFYIGRCHLLIVCLPNITQPNIFSLLMRAHGAR